MSSVIRAVVKFNSVPIALQWFGRYTGSRGCRLPRPLKPARVFLRGKSHRCRGENLGSGGPISNNDHEKKTASSSLATFNKRWWSTIVVYDGRRAWEKKQTSRYVHAASKTMRQTPTYVHHAEDEDADEEPVRELEEAVVLAAHPVHRRSPHGERAEQRHPAHGSVDAFEKHKAWTGTR